MRHDEAIATADEALGTAEAQGYRPLVWRLRATRARALAGLGRLPEAETERGAARAIVDALAGPIRDAEQRRAFATGVGLFGLAD